MSARAGELQAQPPEAAEGDPSPPELVTDPDVVTAYLEDASSGPPGRARGVVRAAAEAQAARFLRDTLQHRVPVLFQAARSSLTGGAVPAGEVVLSVERLRSMGEVRPTGAGARVWVGAGARLRELKAHARAHGFDYPPAPTYQEAMLGGTVATNAGGAATFKYGVTRDWVQALRVVLFNGDVLEVERGQAQARPGASFRVRLSDGGVLEVPAPGYRLPPVRKISAGYFAADPLDFVDLLVGSEGTLGLVTCVEVRLAAAPAGELTALIFLRDDAEALALNARLREAAPRAWSGEDPTAPDVRAVEYVDGRGLDLLRGTEAARRLRIAIPGDRRAALLVELELPEALDADAARAHLEAALDGGGRHPLVTFFHWLDELGALEHTQVAWPGDAKRADVLRAFREAVPQAVNERLGALRRKDPGVKKVGGDLIVPVDALPEMLDVYRRGFTARGLDYAVWGHLSDGNLHPNALPRSAEETRRGFEALMEFAREAIRRGGSPLSEHGVGRNPFKKAMVRMLVGDAGVRSMWRIKRALDPVLRLAPGVLLPDPEAAAAS